MKKNIIVTAIVAIISITSYGQLLSAQDKLALEIPTAATYTTNGISSYVKNNFASDSDRVRALFVWVTNNIDYDVDKVKFNRIHQRATINEVLKSRKAVCQGYAELLVQLYKECNINALLVSGYTKQQDGSIAELPHAWVAAELNNNWYLFDPTWAAGAVNDFKFTKRFNNKYYKNLPVEMIRDHMPFDPMYQFLNHTLLYDDFNKANLAINTSKPYFNYTDSIKAHQQLDSLNQFRNIARRINKNGDKNKMVHELLNVITKNQTSGESKIGYDGAVAEYKKAMDVFNRYISFKNSRFANVKDDKEIQQMIDDVMQHFNNAKQMIEPVIAVNDEQKRIIANFNDSFYKFYRRVDEEKIFVKGYLQKRGTSGK